MAQAVILPKLGQTVEESTIVKWHKQEGDVVKKGEVLFEMETDKAVLEAESFFEGTLLKVLVKEGETVPVQSVVAYIGDKGEKVPEAPPPPAAAPAAAAAPAGARAAEAKPTAAPTVPAAPAPRPAAAPAEPAKRPAAAKPAPVSLVQEAKAYFISPRAKALARAKAIDASKIRGTGENGRVTEKDVLAHLEAHGYANLRISPAAKNLAVAESIDILGVKGTGEGGRIMVHDVQRAMAERPQKMSKMRQVIARRLTESFTGTPHFYVAVSVDMTDLMAYRQELKARGAAYTVTDFILEAVILSLKEFPLLNSTTDGEYVQWRGAVELGMAVGLEQGLVVPVIRRAEDLSMAELHEAAQTLAKKARDGKLLPDEMVGSTFTVSNMGMLNVEDFAAIINPGESGILAVSSTTEQVVARGGKMAIRAMMKMRLSTDHRIVDGTVGAAFVNAVKSKLEDIELWKSLTS